jgi:regulatory associated protein of mTOR
LYSDFKAAEGIVRLYRNYDSSLDHGPVQMVSAFRGLNEVIRLRQGSGVVTDWKQSAGTLLVGGDSHVVKVWDAQTETQGLVRLEDDHTINWLMLTPWQIGSGYQL